MKFRCLSRNPFGARRETLSPNRKYLTLFMRSPRTFAPSENEISPFTRVPVSTATGGAGVCLIHPTIAFTRLNDPCKVISFPWTLRRWVKSHARRVFSDMARDFRVVPKRETLQWASSSPQFAAVRMIRGNHGYSWLHKNASNSPRSLGFRAICRRRVVSRVHRNTHERTMHEPQVKLTKFNMTRLCLLERRQINLRGRVDCTTVTGDVTRVPMGALFYRLLELSVDERFLVLRSIMSGR